MLFRRRNKVDAKGQNDHLLPFLEETNPFHTLMLRGGAFECDLWPDWYTKHRPYGRRPTDLTNKATIVKLE